MGCYYLFSFTAAFLFLNCAHAMEHQQMLPASSVAQRLPISIPSLLEKSAYVFVNKVLTDNNGKISHEILKEYIESDEELGNILSGPGFFRILAKVRIEYYFKRENFKHKNLKHRICNLNFPNSNGVQDICLSIINLGLSDSLVCRKFVAGMLNNHLTEGIKKAELFGEFGYEFLVGNSTSRIILSKPEIKLILSSKAGSKEAQLMKYILERYDNYYNLIKHSEVVKKRHQERLKKNGEDSALLKFIKEGREKLRIEDGRVVAQELHENLAPYWPHEDSDESIVSALKKSPIWEDLQKAEEPNRLS